MTRVNSLPVGLSRVANKMVANKRGKLEQHASSGSPGGRHSVSSACSFINTLTSGDAQKSFTDFAARSVGSVKRDLINEKVTMEEKVRAFEREEKDGFLEAEEVNE